MTIPLHVLEETGLGPGDELKVDVDGAGQIVTRAIDVDVAARLRAIEETAGSLTGVYEPGYLDRLRDERR